MTTRTKSYIAVGALVAALLLLFLVPWTLAIGSFVSAMNYGWPGPYARDVAGLHAGEEMLGFGMAGGVAAVILLGGVVVVGFAARRLDLPVGPIAAISAAVVLVTPTVIALALT